MCSLTRMYRDNRRDKKERGRDEKKGQQSGDPTSASCMSVKGRRGREAGTQDGAGRVCKGPKMAHAGEWETGQ